MAKAAAKRKQERAVPAHGFSLEEWEAINRFAGALEKGRFDEYVAVLQNPRRLFWKSFVAAVGKGFGAVVGATVVVALVAALLAAVGPHLPKPAGSAAKKAGQSIENSAK